MTQTNNEREAFESWFKTFMPETYSQHVNDEDIEATRQHHSAWLAWQARAQSPISQNEQQEVVAYTDGEGDFITKEMYDEYLKLGFYTECIVPLYTSPPKQAIPTVEQEHCCPECGCHFVGEFPFEYKTKQVSLPDGWVAVPIYALFNQKGEMQKCSHSFEIVTNHFPMNTYPTEIWNAMFNGDANEREIQLNKIGWEVKEGYFVDKAMLVSAPTNTEVGNE